MIEIDNSLVTDDAPYCDKLDYLGLQESITESSFTLQPPSPKELDLLANPFQSTRFAKQMPPWSGGKNAFNSHRINATMIGGPRVLPSGQRRWRRPNPLESIEKCTTALTKRKTEFGHWSMVDIWDGFEYHIFRAIDGLSNVRYVVSAFLPRYVEGEGIDRQVWIDRHVRHHGDAWLSFMQAIICNLRRELPTVLLSGSNAYMIIGIDSYDITGNAYFDFKGYQLEDVPLSSRPSPQILHFENQFFHNRGRENCRENIRDAMAFVAFEPI